MSASLECFADTIIGLSRTDCDCYGTPPSDFSVTDSGLYLDEVEGLNLDRIFSAKSCSKDGWTIMERARHTAVLTFVNEVLMGIRQGTTWSRQPGRSVIGGAKGTKAVDLNKPYHGAQILLANHIGGTGVVNRLGSTFKFTGTVNVDIYDRDTLLYTRQINAVANQAVWTDIEPFTLEMDGLTSDNNRYWFVFQPAPGQQALSYGIASCNCSGKPKWALSGSLESAVVIDGQAWTAWAIASGTYGTDINDKENWATANETQGLMIDIDFKCDARTAICDGSPDYQQDPVQMSLAMGVAIQAALNIIAEVTSSTRVIRENIMGGDELELLRVALKKDKGDIIQYLVEVFTGDGVNTYSDCFTCKMDQVITAKTMRR